MEPRERAREHRRRRLRRERGALALLVLAALASVGVAALRPAAHPRKPPPVARPHRTPAHPRPVARAPLRPPQFLVVSFDGSGGVRLWPYWRGIARRAGAH